MATLESFATVCNSGESAVDDDDCTGLGLRARLWQELIAGAAILCDGRDTAMTAEFGIRHFVPNKDQQRRRPTILGVLLYSRPPSPFYFFFFSTFFFLSSFYPYDPITICHGVTARNSL